MHFLLVVIFFSAHLSSCQPIHSFFECTCVRKYCSMKHKVKAYCNWTQEQKLFPPFQLTFRQDWFPKNKSLGKACAYVGKLWIERSNSGAFPTYHVGKSVTFSTTHSLHFLVSSLNVRLFVCKMQVIPCFLLEAQCLHSSFTYIVWDCEWKMGLVFSFSKILFGWASFFSFSKIRHRKAPLSMVQCLLLLNKWWRIILSGKIVGAFWKSGWRLFRQRQKNHSFQLKVGWEEKLVKAEARKIVGFGIWIHSFVDHTNFGRILLSHVMLCLLMASIIFLLPFANLKCLLSQSSLHLLSKERGSGSVTDVRINGVFKKVKAQLFSTFLFPSVITLLASSVYKCETIKSWDNSFIPYNTIIAYFEKSVSQIFELCILKSFYIQ